MVAYKVYQPIQSTFGRSNHQPDPKPQQMRTEIEQERQRAKEQLRGELSALTMQGAQKVLGAEINQTSHERLIEELVENW